MRLSGKKGFTLIELLIVVVIIGILAAIAIPKFATTKDKAKLASVKTDIRNYMTAEEAYFSDKNTYGTSATLMATPYNFSLSAGNSVGATDAADSTGYNIQFQNASISTGVKACQVQVGMGAATGVDGVIKCQ
ncbi:MAG TPA: prepilin-type N-terminal cleavage/methylation domain-containing protein [Gemmatimonadaceae bacterium]